MRLWAAMCPPMLESMFVVSEEEAAAIRTAFEQDGEFSAVVEFRRRFPLIQNNEQARTHVRTIAGWRPQPEVNPAGNVVPLRKR